MSVRVQTVLVQFITLASIYFYLDLGIKRGDETVQVLHIHNRDYVFVDHIVKPDSLLVRPF